jgi:hypothetical protein
MTHVIMWTPLRSPPPPTPITPLSQTIPRWHELAPQLQTHLLIHLTALLLQHLRHADPLGTEADDDNL